MAEETKDLQGFKHVDGRLVLKGITESQLLHVEGYAGASFDGAYIQFNLYNREFDPFSEETTAVCAARLGMTIAAFVSMLDGMNNIKKDMVEKGMITIEKKSEEAPSEKIEGQEASIDD